MIVLYRLAQTATTNGTITVMEFLPSDITPLHDPAQTPCDIEICLDPRRAAEDSCDVALRQYPVDKGITGPWRSLWRDIELGLQNPNLKFPDITERLNQVDLSNIHSTTWFQAQILGTTAPLFTYRAQREQAPLAAVDQIYNGIAALTDTVTDRYNKAKTDPMKKAIIGNIAELVIHGTMLRAHRDIPYLGSPREESSRFPTLNHDVVFFPGETPSKLPVQVKTNAGRGVFTQNRVLFVGVEKILSSPHLNFDTIQDCYRNSSRVRTVANLIAFEAGRRHAAKSPEAQTLRAIGKLLSGNFEKHQEALQTEAVAESIKNFVEVALEAAQPARYWGAAVAMLPQSEHLQLENGNYVFFNRITVAKRSSRRRVDHIVDIGLRDYDLARLRYRQEKSNPPAVTEETFSGQPAELPLKLLGTLAQSQSKIVWEPVVR